MGNPHLDYISMIIDTLYLDVALESWKKWIKSTQLSRMKYIPKSGTSSDVFAKKLSW